MRDLTLRLPQFWRDAEDVSARGRHDCDGPRAALSSQVYIEERALVVLRRNERDG